MIEDLDFIVIPYFRGIELPKNELENFELHESIEMLIDRFIEHYDENEEDNKIKYQFNIINLLGNWLCIKDNSIVIIYFNYYDCMNEHIYSDINYGYIAVAYITGEKDFYLDIFNYLQKYIYDRLENQNDTKEYIIQKYDQICDLHNYYFTQECRIPRWCKMYLKYILVEREKYFSLK